MNLRREGGNRAAAGCTILWMLWGLGAAAADPPSGAAAPKAIAIEIVARKPLGGVRTVRLERGEAIVLQLRADEKMVVHVHGYELHADLLPGSAATLPLLARFEGRFPVTAHLEGKAQGHHGLETTLLYLEVYPP